MKRILLLIALSACESLLEDSATSAGAAPVLAVVKEPGPSVFGAGERTINVLISNRTDLTTIWETKAALIQSGGQVAALYGNAAGDKLEIPAAQTVFGSLMISFPAVKTRTRFYVQWLDSTNRVFGTTEVWVYPTNLLAELKPIAGGEPLGIFDPGNQLKPWLQSLAIEFQDLVEKDADKFHGRLAIIGPFASRQDMRGSLKDDVRALALRGMAVVWLQPAPERDAALVPSFYTVRIGNGAVVVAQNELVSNLAERPEAQLNLIRLAELAVRPQSLDLPEPGKPN